MQYNLCLRARCLRITQMSIKNEELLVKNKTRLMERVPESFHRNSLIDRFLHSPDIKTRSISDNYAPRKFTVQRYNIIRVLSISSRSYSQECRLAFWSCNVVSSPPRIAIKRVAIAPVSAPQPMAPKQCACPVLRTLSNTIWSRAHVNQDQSGEFQGDRIIRYYILKEKCSCVQ